MAPSSARSLGASCLLNGAAVPGLLALETVSNAYFAADRFRVRVALSASGYAPWSGYPLSVALTASVDGAVATLLEGQVDRVRVDAARQEIVADGRDLTALFVDAPLRQSFENQTAAEIVATLAARHGLSANAAVTQDLVGRDFQNDYVSTALAQHAHVSTEWDLLVRLAEAESCDLWVSGQMLNFQPATADPAPILVTPQDCTQLDMERMPAVEANASVEVRSWDCRGSRIVAQRSAGAPGQTGEPRYVITRPNLSPQAAQRVADRTAAMIARRARVLTLDMPGDLEAAPRRGLLLSGSGTDFDGVYEIVSVVRRLSFSHGFSQTVEAILPSWTS